MQVSTKALQAALISAGVNDIRFYLNAVFINAITGEVVWEHPEMLVVAAAGNAAVDLNPADGVVDAGSVGSPATAKNVLSVGASEGRQDVARVLGGVCELPQIDGQQAVVEPDGLLLCAHQLDQPAQVMDMPLEAGGESGMMQPGDGRRIKVVFDGTRPRQLPHRGTQADTGTVDGLVPALLVERVQHQRGVQGPL